AFVGAALGPTRALITVFLGATLGAVTFAGVVIPVALLRRGHAREQTELALGSPPFETPLVPFGVFLAPAALLTFSGGMRCWGGLRGRRDRGSWIVDRGSWIGARWRSYSRATARRSFAMSLITWSSRS